MTEQSPFAAVPVQHATLTLTVALPDGTSRTLLIHDVEILRGRGDGVQFAVDTTYSEDETARIVAKVVPRPTHWLDLRIKGRLVGLPEGDERGPADEVYRVTEHGPLSAD